MRHTKNEIELIAIKVMEDIDWTYDKINSPRALEFSIQEQIEQVDSQKNHPRFEEYVANLFPFWNVLFDFLEDDNWQGRNVMWVKVNDDTGEPYEVGHRQWKGKIVKDDMGIYQKQDY